MKNHDYYFQDDKNCLSFRVQQLQLLSKTDIDLIIKEAKILAFQTHYFNCVKSGIINEETLKHIKATQQFYAGLNGPTLGSGEYSEKGLSHDSAGISDDRHKYSIYIEPIYALCVKANYFELKSSKVDVDVDLEDNITVKGLSKKEFIEKIMDYFTDRCVFSDAKEACIQLCQKFKIVVL
jgi:hypothetical protein